MKFGISTYSLWNVVRNEGRSFPDVIEWIAANGGEHAEIVTFGLDLAENPRLAEELAQKAAACGIELSNYAISADFASNDQEDFERELARVKREVDVARTLGVKRMRHDVAMRPPAAATVRQYMADFERLVTACRAIADYAAPYGIVTSVENHGFHVQGSERVQALIHAVDRENFRTTIDIGNFLCVDEDPVVAVRRNIPYASMIHLKDFYVRRSSRDPGEGFFQTAGGNFLRGAIVGHGDIDMVEVLRTIKSSGYSGYISLEFAGLEDCRLGARLGLENAKRIWEQL
ncbi:MAG: sugar phosphate isomerase/epimerase [Paenibacillaceae bacterium]|nr:sugar phosphate isomerase/epimerase [Paenibacillaceae bacterium]